MSNEVEMPSPEEMATEMQTLATDLNGALAQAKAAQRQGTQLAIAEELAENVLPLLGRLANVVGYQTVIAAQVTTAMLEQFADEQLPDLVEDLVEDILGSDSLTPETTSLLLQTIERLSALAEIYTTEADRALVAKARAAILDAAPGEESPENETEEETEAPSDE